MPIPMSGPIVPRGNFHLLDAGNIKDSHPVTIHFGTTVTAPHWSRAGVVTFDNSIYRLQSVSAKIGSVIDTQLAQSAAPAGNILGRLSVSNDDHSAPLFNFGTAQVAASLNGEDGHRMLFDNLADLPIATYPGMVTINLNIITPATIGGSSILRVADFFTTTRRSLAQRGL